jgi:hypothetical protein
MSGACGMNGGEEKCVWVTGRRATGKETARKTKAWVDR